ncbi:hypothetical protein, partial [Psychromarinibacter sediminicola]|uniref:hypothetical protein n=1 Tax=Psychromarinibacter sediminicola TaxID=3033385 RepID=UPI0023BAB78A
MKNAFLRTEEQYQILDRLDKLREQGDLDKIRQHTVLAFKEDDTLESFGINQAHIPQPGNSFCIQPERTGRISCR